MIPSRSTFVERRDRSLLTPEYEDAGLFKSDILRLTLDLTPMTFRNSRQDLIVSCYHETGRRFEVTFAGRRSSMATPLIASLETLKAKAAEPTDGASDVAAVRIPIKVEGAWRRRFWTDHDGWLTRVHQFVAARWAVPDGTQRPVMYGMPPAIGALIPAN